MKNVSKDPITGIIIGTGALFGGLSRYMEPGSALETFALVISAMTLGLFVFRFIRMWKNLEYNPPTRMLPILQLIYALMWFAVVIIWWDEANSTDDFIGIGMMIVLVIFAAKELYEAVKMFIKARNR